MSANEQQLKAIYSPIDGNTRVLAPPGSGKTYIIEHRYKHLVDSGIDPAQIVVVTFSSRMAIEMQERIKATCPVANIDQICTIHALCKRMLTSWNPHSSYYGWSVPKEWEVKKQLQDSIDKIWLEEEKPGYKEVLYWIDNAKYHGIEHSLSLFTDYLGEDHGEWVQEIRVEFDGWLKYRRCMTFADMLYFTELGMKNIAFRLLWQSKFPYIMIDEAQDTNSQAMRILLGIAKYTFLVGDVDQMMFRFQGARPELTLEDYAPDIQTVKLEKNYRSTSSIISLCQKLIAHNYSDLGGPYPQNTMKDVSGIREDGLEVSYQFVGTIEDEAELVASTILEQTQAGFKYGDFFVGARTRAQLGYIEGALTRNQIKYVNLAGGSFWQNKHIADVLAYLRLAFNQQDNEAFKRVYNIASVNNRDRNGKYLHHRWLGAEFLRVTGESYLGVYKAPQHNKRYWSGVRDLTDFVKSIQVEIHESETVGDIINFIIQNCYLKWMQADEGLIAGDESENGKLEDLRTVQDIASRYKDVQSFLVYVDECIESSQGNYQDCVVISTYHRLKGLERRVMIGTGWCEGIDTQTEEPRGLLPHTFSLIDPPQFGVLPSGNGASPIADERCIGFVCCSRAKDLVFLSGCRKYRKWIMQPSRFIVEMGLVEENDNLYCPFCSHILWIDDEYMTEQWNADWPKDKKEWTYYCDDYDGGCGEAGTYNDMTRGKNEQD